MENINIHNVYKCDDNENMWLCINIIDEEFYGITTEKPDTDRYIELFIQFSCPYTEANRYEKRFYITDKLINFKDIENKNSCNIQWYGDVDLQNEIYQIYYTIGKFNYNKNVENDFEFIKSLQCTFPPEIDGNNMKWTNGIVYKIIENKIKNLWYVYSNGYLYEITPDDIINLKSKIDINVPDWQYKYKVQRVFGMLDYSIYRYIDMIDYKFDYIKIPHRYIKNIKTIDDIYEPVRSYPRVSFLIT